MGCGASAAKPGDTADGPPEAHPTRAANAAAAASTDGNNSVAAQNGAGPSSSSLLPADPTLPRLPSHALDANAEPPYLPLPSEAAGPASATDENDGGGSSSSAAAAAETFTPDGPVILVLGGPGSGKDTQCERLISKYGATHLSTVELVREAVESHSAQGAQISNMIRAGQIPTAQVYLDLIREAMRKRKGPYLIQGFPKALDQLNDFEARFGACSGAIYLRASEEALTERLLNRGKTSTRTDDTPQAITRRVRTFQLECVPVVEALDRSGRVSTIDGTLAEEDVFSQVASSYERLVAG